MPVPIPRSPLRPLASFLVGAVTLGACCSLIAVAASPAAAAAAPCVPPEPRSSATVARADRTDGTSEVTEFQTDGGYRVTRCSATGALIVSQTVSPIPDPDGGVMLVQTERVEPGEHLAALYGDAADPAWAADVRRNRRAIEATVIPPTTRTAAGFGPERSAATDASRSHTRAGAPGGAALAQVAGDQCSNGQWTAYQTTWSGRSYNYYANRSRFAYNDAVVASIVAGHRAWDTTYNDCGFGDITNLNSYYIGSTTETSHTAADGISVMDKGDMPTVGCAGAIACTWLFNNASGVSSETDTRFSSSLPWSTVGASGAYDYQSVATHESGHSIGLDHANSSSALTMFYTLPTGTTHARTLARGDVLGMRARYP